MDTGLVNTILSDKSLLTMLLTPGLLFSVLIIYLLYKILKIVGEKYLEIQERQVAAFEELVKSVTALEHYLREAKMREDAIDMTLRKISEDIALIKILKATGDDDVK